MKYIVSISGGKDSTASLLYLLDIAKKEDVIPVFCDTKWEADETYEYLNYLENKLDIDIVRIETEGMIELARRKKFVPNRHIKTCTENLKIRPFEKWLLNNYIGKEDFIVVEGVRREESKNRENTPNFTIKKSLISPKFDKPTLYPIVDWSTQEVFEYIKNKGLEVNTLYKKGFKRVGCMPCVNASKYELLYLPNKYKKRLKNLENIVSKEINKEAFMFHPNKRKFLCSNLLFNLEELFEPPPDCQGV
jgi:3'-phosphoadenosine 5'-phosphosulfate sulfotransferase (PAPS reductase)/FAD synthetase